LTSNVISKLKNHSRRCKWKESPCWLDPWGLFGCRERLMGTVVQDEIGRESEMRKWGPR